MSTMERNIMLEIEQREREMRRMNSDDTFIRDFAVLYLKPAAILVLKVLLISAVAALFTLALPNIIDSILETYDL